MRRRDFISLLGGAAAGWPFAVRAQQTTTKIPRIGIIDDAPIWDHLPSSDKRRTTRTETRCGASGRRLPKPWAAGWTVRRALAAMPLAVPPCQHSCGSRCPGKLSRNKAATHGDPNHVSGLPDAAAEKMRPQPVARKVRSRPVVRRAIF